MGQPWFGAKTYGIGIGPKSRKGWIAVIAYIALIAAAPIIGRSYGCPDWTIATALAVVTAGFIVLMVLKSDGEPWRWRWGDR